MSKKKWFVLAGVGCGLVLIGMALVLLLMFGLFSGFEETPAGSPPSAGFTRWSNRLPRMPVIATTA